ncbi:MAG: hypothetical protein ACO1QS_21020 [Verrucomicrobiota bacterium]
MKRVLLAVLSGGVVLATSLMAQEAPQKPREEAAKAAKPEALPSREQIRKELEALPPEQREAKMKEMKEREAKAPAAGDLEKRREEFKNLPPEQREAKMKEFREQFMARRTELEKKKTAGTLTPEEEKALERMNEMAKRGGKDGQTRRPKAE